MSKSHKQNDTIMIGRRCAGFSLSKALKRKKDPAPPKRHRAVRQTFLRRRNNPAAVDQFRRLKISRPSEALLQPPDSPPISLLILIMSR